MLETSSMVDFAVSVTPANGAVGWAANTSGHTRVFTVTNTGTCPDIYDFTTTATAPISGVTLSKTNATLQPGQNTTVTATYSVGAPATGVLTFFAFGTASDTAYLTVSAIDSVSANNVSVTPVGGAAPPRLANSSGFKAGFTVLNTSSVSQTYTMTCQASANITCTAVTPASLTLAMGASAADTVTYSTGAVGSGLVQLTAANSYARNSGSYDVPIVATAVLVTPDNQAVGALAAASDTQRFTVKNASTAGATYTFSVLCTGAAVTGCSTPPSLPLASGAAGIASVAFTGGSTGSTGRISLLATSAPNSDSGWVTVTAGTAQAPSATIADPSPGATITRDLCLAIAAGPGAAAECGDLRVVHPLPTTRTYGKARTPTLIYNSLRARAFPLVGANVTLPAGAANPDSVVVNLYFGIVIHGRGTWAGGNWSPGRTSRVVVAETVGDTTGVYNYTLDIRSWYGATSYPVTPSPSGQLTVVNGSNSPFGAGWWLAGLERLYPGTMLWVGGDGSVTQYQPAGTNVWAGPNVDRPDTLKWDGSTYYVRYLPHGVQVKFDATGKHVQTVNRLGQITRFNYDACGRLSAIKLPPDTTKLYQFTFQSPSDCSTRLTSVTAPPAGGQTRTVTLTLAGGRVTAIRDPDNTSVAFAYSSISGDTNLIVTRTDRRGTPTTFQYNTAKKLTRASITMATRSPGQVAIVRLFRPVESTGAPNTGTPSAVDTALAYSRFDGSRSDVGDTTIFWIDRYGAPRRVIDALGFETTLTRTNAAFPALVTKVRRPNGGVVTATYDGRGNITSTTDSSTPPQGGRYATIRYEWDATWDFVTKIVPPENDSTVIAYNATNGNRLWQQDARGTISRDSLFYYQAGPVSTGLLRASQSPLAFRDSVVYDTLGNLFKTRTPLGFWSTFYKDNLGRDTLLLTPVDSAQTKQQRQRFTYDLKDRVTLTATFGPTVSYQTVYDPSPVNVDSGTVTVQNFYGPEGDLDSLWRSSAPDVTSLQTIKTQWRYDAASRLVKEIAPDGQADSTVYDPAGNVTRRIDRRGQIVTMDYDALSRLSRRVLLQVAYNEETTPGWNWQNQTASWPMYSDGLTIPVDTQTFTYDPVGNMLTANNLYAHISRAYNPNGSLSADTLRVNTWTGSDFTQHVYGLRFGYDLDGRRTWLKHPATIAPRIQSTVKDSTDYSYAVNGQLASVTDPQGNRFQLFYDAEGQLDSLEYPGQIYEKRYYDGDGRLWRRVERTHQSWVPGDSGFVRDPIRDDTLRFDARGKITKAKFYADPVGSSTARDSTVNWYSGLGHAAASQEFQELFTSYLIEEYRYDALGNMAVRRKYVADKTQADSNTYTYWPSSGGRLLMTKAWKGNAPVDSSTYDPAGNRHFLFREEYDSFCTPTFFWSVAATYYDAAERVRVLDRRTINCIDPAKASLVAGGFEEYRYDALGRRIAFRVRRDSTCFTQCDVIKSTINRTVWDGDEVLYEIRYPGGDNVSATNLERDTVLVDTLRAPYGRVTYTHGLGVDAPLDIIRMTYSDSFPAPVVVIPHSNWRGQYDFGSFDNGTKNRCKKLPGGGNSGVCVSIDWPGNTLLNYLGRRTSAEPQSWIGALKDNWAQASGQHFYRNRYYDPLQGRFTQEDPIGLGGGINLYGFAGGDPVNFSDPFGLCPNPPCFRVFGDAQFSANWNRMVAKSPYLRSLVAQASRPTSPEFNLVQTRESIFNATNGQAGGGLTQALDASGVPFNPKEEPETPIATINAFVSTTDASDPELQEIARKSGKVLTVSNLQAHEFGHGILLVQGYKSTEAQANKVECKAMSETGGACKP